jgi:hypothetical protein
MTKGESMTNDIPQHFDEAFLRWFRERTEETWRRYQTRTFEEFVASRVGGHDWQQGTRWLGGLSEQEIATIEQHYHVRFPLIIASFSRCCTAWIGHEWVRDMSIARP